MNRTKPKQSRDYKAEQEIIKAAQKVFSKKGYSGTTVTDIITTAKTSTGNFYYRFKGKKALFNYMFECFVDRVDDSLKNLSSEHESIGSLLYEVIEHNAKIIDENWGSYLAINEISICNPETWDKLRILTEATADKIIINAQPFINTIVAPNPERAIQHAIRHIASILANQAVHYLNDKNLSHPENVIRIYRASMGILAHFPEPNCPVTAAWNDL